MPTVVRLRLIPEEDVCLRLDRAPAQGWFLALAKASGLTDAQGLPPTPGETPDAGEGSWSDALHRDNVRQPYAVSPLYQAGRASLWEDDTIRRWLTEGPPPRPEFAPARANREENATVRIPRGRRLALRISLADDQRAQGLLKALPSLILPRLGAALCRLERFPTLAPDDPDTLQASWAALANAPAAERLRVSFETPTAAGHDGGSRPRLTAAQLLKSWQEAWRLAPEPERPPGVAGLTPEDLWVDDAGLWKESLLIKGGRREGFVGEVEIGPQEGAEADTRRAVTALVGVADFFGTGAKTAMGMGQTRVRVGGAG